MDQLSRRFVLGATLAGIAAPRLARAAPSGEIVLMAYSGTFQDNYTKAVVEPFMAANPGRQGDLQSGRQLGADARHAAGPAVASADRRGHHGFLGLPRRQQGRPVSQVHARRSAQYGEHLRPGKNARRLGSRHHLRQPGDDLQPAECEAAAHRNSRSAQPRAQGPHRLLARAQRHRHRTAARRRPLPAAPITKPRPIRKSTC